MTILLYLKVTIPFKTVLIHLNAEDITILMHSQLSHFLMSYLNQKFAATRSRNTQ